MGGNKMPGKYSKYNKIECLGTFPELAQIYANIVVCDKYKPQPYRKDFDFALRLNAHNKIFKALRSLAKRLDKKPIASCEKAYWRKIIADLAEVNLTCMICKSFEYDKKVESFVELIKNIFKELKI
jgi:hypothetical protein